MIQTSKYLIIIFRTYSRKYKNNSMGILKISNLRIQCPYWYASIDYKNTFSDHIEYEECNGAIFMAPIDEGEIIVHGRPTMGISDNYQTETIFQMENIRLQTTSEMEKIRLKNLTMYRLDRSFGFNFRVLKDTN